MTHWESETISEIWIMIGFVKNENIKVHQRVRHLSEAYHDIGLLGGVWGGGTPLPEPKFFWLQGKINVMIIC